jgi:hypothetical protein
MFPNTGFIEAKLTEEQLAPIKFEINNIQSNFKNPNNIEHNNFLAGNIEGEFKLIDSKNHLQNILLPLVKQFDDDFNYFKEFSHLTLDKPIILDTAWVNFQKKTEFNPWHAHHGILSFVIWINVPYDYDDELKYTPGSRSNAPSAGTFVFSYTSSVGKIETLSIAVDKSIEGSLVLFPAKLLHTVYPFYTSDNYRISVSGNFKFDV